MKYTLPAASAVVVSAVVAWALAHPEPARSQSSATRTLIPLGTHGTGVNNASSYAWFIDANDRKVILCFETAVPAAPGGAAAGSPHKVNCTSTPLP